MESESDLGSDFGGSVVEHEVDSDGEIVEKGERKETKKEDKAEDKDEKKKKKRMEKLDKKINALKKKTGTVQAQKDRVKKAIPAEIRNKHKRQEVVLRDKIGKRADKKLELLK